MNSGRRAFIKKSAVSATGITLAGLGMSAKSYGRILGSNERIHVAMIGCNRRGIPLTDSLAALKDKVQYEYVCDVIQERRDNLGKKVEEKFGYAPKAVNDLRKIHDDKKVDAVFHATPDHWHAPGGLMAMQAGKHVYIEKPLTHSPQENEILIQAEKKYNRMVQMGAQQRSAPESKEIMRELHEGVIGDIYLCQAFYSNARGSIGNGKKVPVPEGFDWQLFQGPAPRVDYKDILYDYNWHWFWNWGTGETGNNATHELDISRWALQKKHPVKVSVSGGKYHFKDDDWVMYDTLDATFTYDDGKVIKWDGKSRNSMMTYGSGRGTIIYGTDGSVYIDRGGYKVYDRGGKLLREKKSAGEEGSTGLGGGGDMTTMHVNNFLEAIRGKAELACPVETGALSTQLCHYANIAYRVGKALDINPETGKFTDTDAIKLWSREYEKGWEPKI
ncbi:MAG: Gfo/Idh/MocA family protein [Bacteroidota bacterium]